MFENHCYCTFQKGNANVLCLKHWALIAKETQHLTNFGYNKNVYRQECKRKNRMIRRQCRRHDEKENSAANRDVFSFDVKALWCVENPNYRRSEMQMSSAPFGTIASCLSRLCVLIIALINTFQIKCRSLVVCQIVNCN